MMCAYLNCGFLGCNTVQSLRPLPTFQRSILLLWIYQSKKDERLLSCSPPSSTTLRYLSPLNNSHFLVLFSTSSFHLSLSSWCKLAWHAFLVFLVPSIRCRYPIHLRRCILIKITILTYFRRKVFPVFSKNMRALCYPKRR